MFDELKKQTIKKNWWFYTATKKLFHFWAYLGRKVTCLECALQGSVPFPEEVWAVGAGGTHAARSSPPASLAGSGTSPARGHSQQHSCTCTPGGSQSQRIRLDKLEMQNIPF